MKTNHPRPLDGSYDTVFATASSSGHGSGRMVKF